MNVGQSDVDRVVACRSFPTFTFEGGSIVVGTHGLAQGLAQPELEVPAALGYMEVIPPAPERRSTLRFACPSHQLTHHLLTADHITPDSPSFLIP